MAGHAGEGGVEIPAVSDKLAWAKALDQLMSHKLDAVPREWKVPEVLAKEMGICYEMAKLKCRDLVKARLAERKDFRVKWGKGARLRPHYRLIAKTSKNR